MNNYVPGHGSSSAKLLICGEAPGKHEVEHGYPFAGPTGELLNQALSFAGVDRNDCYLTNVCKVRPPNNKLDNLKLIGHTLEEFIPQLWDEIVSINPNCILALGNTALTALTGNKGIEKYRGSILQCKTGHKVVPTLHPASLMPHEGSLSAIKQWKEFAWIKADVKRAVEQSLFRDYKPPQRNLQVAGSSIQVMRFLDKYANNDKVAVDVETYKTFTQCVGLAFNDWDALSIPIFSEDIADTELAFTWKLLSEFFHDTHIKIMAQNAKFDEKRCRQIGLDWHDCWFDMAMGWHCLYPEFPKKLQFISSVITEEPYYKDEGTEFNKGRTKEQNLRQWYLYNAKDAVVEFECCTVILQELKDAGMENLFFDKVMPLHRLYSDIEDVGILVDLEVRKHLREKYEHLRIDRQKKLVNNIANGDPEIAELYKNFNVNSNGPKNQVAKLLYGFLKLPVRKDTGDDTLKALANNVAKNQRIKDILLGVLEVRKLRKTIGTYIDAKPSPSDATRFGSVVYLLSPGKARIHTQCNLNGTESFRTSTGILQPPVSIEKEGIALQTMTKHEDINLEAGGGDLRAEFIADQNFVFIEPDLSQAEDRVVCVLAKDWDALRDYERKVFRYNQHGLKDDRHTNTAIYVCGMDFNAITDWERQVGKKTRHSGNYAVGKHQHMLTLGKSGIFVSEYKAGQQLERFHHENPKIEGIFWADIQQALQDNNCVLYTPFDYRRIFFNKWGPELFKEAYAFIPQNVVSSVVRFAMLKIAKRLGDAYKKLFFFQEESHDSFLALCHKTILKETAIIIKEEFEQPIDFNKGSLQRDYKLVIPCEIKVGQRWIEKNQEWPDGMEKYKI